MSEYMQIYVIAITLVLLCLGIVCLIVRYLNNTQNNKDEIFKSLKLEYRFSDEKYMKEFIEIFVSLAKEDERFLKFEHNMKTHFDNSLFLPYVVVIRVSIKIKEIDDEFLDLVSELAMENQLLYK